MEFRKKIYPSVFKKYQMESAKDKQILNLILIDEIKCIVKEISGWKNYLDQYWYNLKMFVYSLHASYRLLYKNLSVYGNECICKKYAHHNLMYGTRTVVNNARIFNELIEFILLQLEYVGSILRFRLKVSMHDKVTQLLHHLIKFLDKMIWLDDTTGELFKDGLPVKYNFL